MSTTYIIPFKSGPETPERDVNLAKTISRLNHFGEDYLVETSEEPFNRSKLLNAGADKASGDTLFFLDSDILIPETFTSMVEDVLTRYDIFFPICYSLHENGTGWWRHSGLGLVGCKSVVWRNLKLSWNENRTKWGGEDNNLFALCESKYMSIARFWVPGLIHQWHPDSQEYKNVYTVST